MNKSLRFVTISISILLIILNLSIAVYYCFHKTVLPVGDENFFLGELITFQNNGWWRAFAEGMSYPYIALLSLLVSTFNLSALFSLRLTSLLATILFFISIYFILKRQISNKPIRWLALLTITHIVATLQFYYSGINDYLFILFLLWSFEFALSYKQQNKYSYLIYAFLMLTLGWLTRPMAIMYLPGLLLIIFWKNTSWSALFKILRSAVPSIVLFIIVQLPAIITHKEFRFEDKNPKDLPYNWAQRQYVAQIMYEEGTLPPTDWATWEDVENYLSLHGSNSLPRSTSETLLWDIGRTFREFIKDSITSWRYILRFGGVFILFIIPVFIKKNKFVLSGDLPFFLSVTGVYIVFLFSFIILTNVEVRWLTLPLTFIIWATSTKFEDAIKSNNAFQWLMIVQLLLLAYSTINYFLTLPDTIQFIQQ